MKILDIAKPIKETINRISNIKAVKFLKKCVRPRILVSGYSCAKFLLRFLETVMNVAIDIVPTSPIQNIPPDKYVKRFVVPINLIPKGISNTETDKIAKNAIYIYNM